MGALLVPIISVLIWLLEFYKWVIILYAIASWLIAFGVINTYNRTVARVLDALYRLADPGLRPIRRILPNFGGIDISPIILFAVIYVVEAWLDTLRWNLMGVRF
jgi:YggT family protein